MNTLMLISIVVLGIGSVALQIKRDDRFIQFFNLLVFGSVAQLLTSAFDPESTGVVYSLIGLVSLNFVAAQIGFLQKPFLRFLVPLLSFGGFLMLIQGTTINFLGADYISVNKFLVGGTVFAVLGYELGMAKIKVLKKLFTGVEEEELMNSLLLLFTGLAIFLGSLASSSFGVLIVTGAFLSASFFRKDRTHRMMVSLLIIGVLPFLLSLVEGETAALIDGDVLGGLFIGAFGMDFIQKLWFSSKRNGIAIVLSYALVIGLVFALLWNGTIFYKMGGMDALLGALIGIALVNAIKGKAYTATGLFLFLLTGAVIIPNYMVNEEQKAFEENPIVTIDGGMDKEGKVIPPPKAIPLSEVTGTHTFLKDSSSIQFELGDGGKTKGAFKKVSGSVYVADDMAKSSISVALFMSDFTTFVSSRDKSLLSSEYFNADKFLMMKYIAKGFTKTSDNVYDLNGDFTMLGVTKKVKGSLQLIEIDGRKILIGSGQIDRTLFGMTPDASEGNVVSFNYQVALN